MSPRLSVRPFRAVRFGEEGRPGEIRVMGSGIAAVAVVLAVMLFGFGGIAAAGEPEHRGLRRRRVVHAGR